MSDKMPDELLSAVEAAKKASQLKPGSEAEQQLLGLAKHALVSGRIELADNTIQYLLDTLDARNADTIERANPTTTLISIRLAQRRAEEALSLARNIVAWATAAESESAGLAIVRLNVARVLDALERYGDAADEAQAAAELAPADSMLRAQCRQIEGEARLKSQLLPLAIAALDDAVRILAAMPAAQLQADVRHTLAHALTLSRRYHAALPHREWIENSYRASYGEHSGEHGIALHEHATTLMGAGRYAAAGDRLVRALDIVRRNQGEQGDAVWEICKTLAELAHVSGAWQLARDRYLNLLAQPARIGRLIDAGINLAAVANALGDFRLAQQAINESRRLLQSSLLQGTAPAIDLEQADLLLATQRWAGRRALHRRIRAGIGEAQDVEIATRARFGALLDRLAQRRSGAVAALLAAFDLLLITESSTSPFAAKIGAMIAAPLARGGHPRAVLTVLARTASARRLALIESIRLYGEASSHAALASQRRLTRLEVSSLFALDAPQTIDVRQGYAAASHLHGLETRVLQIRSITNATHLSLRPQLDVDHLQRQLVARKQALAQLELHGDVFGSAAHLHADLTREREAVAALESRLLHRMGSDRLDREFLDIEPDVAHLPADTALVEFTVYDSTRSEPNYGAFVVRDGGRRIEHCNLGPVAVIDRLIDRYRAGVIAQGDPNRDRRIALPWLLPGRRLRSRLFDPLRALLDSCRKLVVIPDGQLALIPFGALPDRDGGFIGERFVISHATSNRLFGIWRFHDEYLGRGTAPVVIGAPNYGPLADGSTSIKLDDDLLGRFQSGAQFDPLPEARGACEDIATQLQVAAQVDNAASKNALLGVNSPEILHLVTHGFVLPLHAGAPGRSGLADPLERSGIALAGANAYVEQAAHDAGVLHATEVATLDLHRTDLVTLAACETGLGDVIGGDGARGLQRAFMAAGARSVIGALWQVPEKPTRRLFASFYAHLLRGSTRSDALQSAIADVARAFPGYPVAWAGFVLYGETGVITRFDGARALTFATVNFGTVNFDSSGPDELPTALAAEALIDEGMAQLDCDADAAFAHFEQVLSMTDITDRIRGDALYGRGNAAEARARWGEALVSYNAALELRNLEPRQQIDALHARARTLVQSGDPAASLGDYTRIAAWPGHSPNSRAETLRDQAQALNDCGEVSDAIAALDAALELVGAEPAVRIAVMLDRARQHISIAQYATGDADARRVFNSQADTESRATAGLILATSLKRQGQLVAATAAIQNTLALEGISDDVRDAAEMLLAD